LIKIFQNILHCKKLYICSVCKKKVDTFIPLPEQYRGKVLINHTEYLEAYKKAEMLNAEAYLCPHCGASDRERFYVLFIEKFFLKHKDREEIKLVHFAPEKALKNFLLTKKFQEYRTADLMMDDVDDKADLTNLHIYQSNHFNFLICSHILEHIPDDISAIKELYRILKIGGMGIIIVPILEGLENIYEDSNITSEEDRLLHFWQEDHVRIYNKKGFIERLSNVGFQVKEYGIKNFSKKVFNQYAISEKSILYIVEKIGHD